MPIGAAFLAAVMLSTVAVDAPGAGPAQAGIELAQSPRDEDRRREEQRERRLKEQREERRQELERSIQERNRRWSEERRARQDRATEELRQRREKEIQDRIRRMEEGYETQEERRARARRERQLHSEYETLRRLFPPDWIPGILAGRVETGWNAKAVIASLGRPGKITRPGRDTEVWHYPDTQVTLTKGKVTAVESQPPKAKPGH